MLGPIIIIFSLIINTLLPILVHTRIVIFHIPLETWTKPERSRNRVRPCGSWRNTESCTCNGETYEGRREKKSCKDEVEYCTCDDGTTWEPEEEDAEEF